MSPLVNEDYNLEDKNYNFKNQREIVMELLTDIATAVGHVAKDYLPGKVYTCQAWAYPIPRVELVIEEAGNDALHEALKAFGMHVDAVLKKSLPSIPLQVLAVGGDRGSGLEIKLKRGVQHRAVYGHIIKLKVDRLVPSTYTKGKV